MRGILPHPLGRGASRWRRSRRSGSYQGGIGVARAAAPAVLQFCFTDAAPAPCAIYDGRFGTASRAEASDRVAEEAAGPLRVAHPRRGPVRSKPPPPPPRSPIASLSELESELAALKRDLEAQTARNAELERRNAERERDADMLRADLADAEAERTRALRLVVGVLGRDRVERALANGGIGSLLRDWRTAYRPTGSMGRRRTPRGGRSRK